MIWLGISNGGEPVSFCRLGLSGVLILFPKRRFEQNIVVGSTSTSLPFFARFPPTTESSLLRKKTPGISARRLWYLLSLHPKELPKLFFPEVGVQDVRGRDKKGVILRNPFPLLYYQ
jgi:hypothetical protein